MTVALITLGVGLLGTILAFVITVRTLTASHREAQAQWTRERRELLNRIQAPQHIPFEPVTEFEVPERTPDEWAKVGTIDIDPDYGLDDE